MVRRRLPIGVQTFREVRETGCYYVDKTAYIGGLLDEGKHYFLSRPRRFGKSLFLDTLKELFEGSEALFEGLHIHDRWDWSVRHPVVRLDFGSGYFQEPGLLHKEVIAQLDGFEREAAVSVRYETAPARFRHLLQTLHARAGQRVVVLVDEYDKPILDALEAPEVARANRDYLRGLYGVIKTSDAHIRFTFLTGVSKFSKVSLFSGLNNLIDITLDRRYSGVCGYTEADLDTVFAAELPGLDGGGDPRLVQWLLLARRGEGVQPLRRAAVVPPPGVRRVVVRDGHPGVSGGDAVRAPGGERVARGDAGHRRAAVGLRGGGGLSGTSGRPRGRFTGAPRRKNGSIRRPLARPANGTPEVRVRYRGPEASP